jgi:hypothetical protein
LLALLLNFAQPANLACASSFHQQATTCKSTATQEQVSISFGL